MGEGRTRLSEDSSVVMDSGQDVLNKLQFILAARMFHISLYILGKKTRDQGEIIMFL